MKVYFTSSESSVTSVNDGSSVNSDISLNNLSSVSRAGAGSSESSESSVSNFGGGTTSISDGIFTIMNSYCTCNKIKDCKHVSQFQR